jgi:predicted transcriptional regulator
MPAGPSITDEVANQAFWTGLMLGKPDEANAIWQTFSFKDVKSNFFKAARSGIETILIWKGKEISARELILEELIPIAYKGLLAYGLGAEECSYFLGVIEKRLNTHTGAQWQVHNFRKLREKLSPSDAAITITAAMYENQAQHLPVHDWQNIDLDKANTYLVNHFSTVSQLMSTDLVTVFPDDSLLFAERLMKWYQINHMLIENRKGMLIGLITASKIADIKSNNTDLEHVLIKDHMTRKLHTISADMQIADALEMMQQLQITSLPVVSKDRMIGIVTRNDMLRWLALKEG